MSLSDNGGSREGRTDGTRFDLGQLLVIVYQRLFGGKAPTSIPPHPEGQDASQPPTQQLPVSLHPNPLQVLRPLPDLMLAVELVSGEGGRGSVSYPYSPSTLNSSKGNAVPASIVCLSHPIAARRFRFRR